MYTSPISSSVATLGAVLTPSSTAVKIPVVLSADKALEFSPGASVTATAGKVDVYVTFVPIPNEELTTSDFKSVVVS
jgi:hypothetical protein